MISNCRISSIKFISLNSKCKRHSCIHCFLFLREMKMNGFIQESRFDDITHELIISMLSSGGNDPLQFSCIRNQVYLVTSERVLLHSGFNLKEEKVNIIQNKVHLIIIKNDNDIFLTLYGIYDNDKHYFLIISSVKNETTYFINVVLVISIHRSSEQKLFIYR